MNDINLFWSGMKIPLIIGLTMILAMLMGSLIGTGDMATLVWVYGGIAAVAWLLYLHQFTWHVALLLCFFGFEYFPAGFELSSLHITAAMGVFLAVMYSWRKLPSVVSPALKDAGFRTFTIAQAALVIYLVGHFLYNWAFPYSPSDLDLKNTAKSYFAIMAPPILTLYFSRRPAGVAPHSNLLRIFAQLMLLALLVNLGVKFYQMFTNIGVDISSFNDVNDIELIPGIHAMVNQYTLRWLGPTAMFLGMLMVTAPPAPRGDDPSRFVSWALIGCGTAGALFSGGRSAVSYGVLLCVLTLCVRGRFATLIIFGVLSGFGIIALNLLSGPIASSTPAFFQRSIQWVLLEKNEEVAGNIQGSTDWRYELFTRAIEEWESQPRIFWFGRATYGYGDNDEALKLLNPDEAGIAISLRRGATHNLVTDLLIAYGLVGALLYFYALLVSLWFIYRLYHGRANDWGTENVCLLFLIPAIPSLITNLLGGGLGDISGAWVTVILLARIRLVEREQALESVEIAPSLVDGPMSEGPALAGFSRDLPRFQQGRP